MIILTINYSLILKILNLYHAIQFCFVFLLFNPPKLLESGYRMLLYNGQMDLVFPYVATENFVNTLHWVHAKEYYASPRKVWRVDGNVAGYVKCAAGLARVLVRNAGHLAAMDQPLWVYDMITRFVNASLCEEV